MLQLTECGMCGEFEEIRDEDIKGNTFVCYKCAFILEKMKKFEVKNRKKIPDNLKLKFFDELREHYEEMGYFERMKRGIKI